ncbi:MAG: hypothetical protein PVI24_00960, partial [Myxococcales bacterium]
VYQEGASDRELYLPEGRWVEWWRTVSYGDQAGTFSMTSQELQEGGTTISVSAPLPEIPMFVRVGAVIPMLWPDVFTLAEFGDDPEIVHASDRDDRLHVLAFPRGETAGSFYADERWTSVEGDGRWTLTLQNRRERTIHLEASMRTLDQPFDVCSVSLDGTPIAEQDWSYDPSTGVLDITYDTVSGALELTGC